MTTGCGPTTASRALVLLLALVVAAAGVATVVIDVVVARDGRPAPLEPGWTSMLAGLAMAVPGLLLAWRMPRHSIAAVLGGFGVFWSLDALASSLVSLAWLTDRDAWWAPAAFWVYARAGAALLLSVQLLLLLFPDGRLPAGRWRVVAIASLALGLVMPLAFLLAPADALGEDEPARVALIEAFDRAPTLPLPAGVWAVVLAAFPVCLGLSMLGALAVAIGRRRRADPVRSAQLRWLAWSGGVFVAGLLARLLVPHPVFDVLLPATIALIGVSVVVAVTRHRLYEIDRLLSWTIVYGVLIAAIVVVDGLLVLVIGTAVDDRAAMLIAVLAVTLAYAPLRDRLLGLAARLVSGRRADAYGVVSGLVARLERAGDRQSRLADLAEAIAETFASRSVRVELGPEDAPTGVAQVGERSPGAAVFPIEYGGRPIGRIELEPGRRPVTSARDRRLLGDLVRLAAVTVQATEAGAQLQAIRERLVLAREDERSRLRRDLHDGLGPLLAGVKLRLEAASNVVERDPGRARGILLDAIDGQGEVIDEIRRIVHDLRPPALDDLGLERAIRQTAERMSDASQAVEVRGTLPAAVPPAVEVAAYRIVAEALTNARRHAGARRVVVDLAASGDALAIDIEDDGVGIARDAVGGVGLRSMRERAEEVGGALELSSPPGGGARILVRLPLRAESAGSAESDPAGHESADPEPAEERHVR